MFNDPTQKTEDPPQGRASTAPNPIFPHLRAGELKNSFPSGHDTPVIKRLGVEDAQAFLDAHTNVRNNLPEAQKKFMKELNPALLLHLLEQNMPVIGVFVGGKMVSGCAILYPSDEKVADYLADYDFNGEKDRTAVISAVWTSAGHTGKGLSKMAVGQGMDLAFFDGKNVFRAKVDKQNGPSLSLFKAFEFDTGVEGPTTGKLYPVLAL